MRTDPLNVVAEILGEPATEMRNPVNADYQCPFINSRCQKTGQKVSGPYPVCTIFYPRRTSDDNGRPICVCPKRFYGIDDLVGDVIRNCWPAGQVPLNPQVAYEVKMEKFGNVDMVVADIDAHSGIVRSFVSVELQAVDTTGSYEPAYQGVLNGNELVDVKYNVNWKNVQKRLMSQLIEKGFYHHHWGSRIAALVQTPLYDRMQQALQFEELPPDRGGNTIIFMLYDYRPDPGRPGALKLQLDRVIGTSHNSLMSSSLYQVVPSKEEFHHRILRNLAK